MDPIDRQKHKREARRRLRAQQQRAGRLRSRVIATSLVCFALLWGIVFVQMATGNDPVLGSSSAAIAGSRRSGGSRNRNPARAAASAAVEAVETSEPEELEPEVVEPEPEAEIVEPEPVEAEVVEPEPVEAEFVEPEPEPAPVITSQS